MMQWYAQQVANHPSLVVLSVLGVATTCLIVSFTTSELPSFKDPLLGFEPRGTKLAQRAAAWRNLLESSGWAGPLSMFPGQKELLGKSSNGTVRSASLQGEDTIQDVIQQGDTNNETERNDGPWKELEKVEQNIGQVQWEHKEEIKSPQPIDSLWKSPVNQISNQQEFFCNDPSRAYAHLIFESTVSGHTLFSLSALHSLCHMQEYQLKASAEYNSLCEYDSSHHKCCRDWSLPNYIALLRERRSCHLIEENDVTAVFELLQSCAHFYHGLKLTHDCSTDPALCRGVPKQCIKHNAIYNILHYLTDVGFMNPKEPNSNDTLLTYTSIFLPIAQSTATMEYYKELSLRNLQDDFVQVAGIQFGLKHALFDAYLLHDTAYVGLAGAVMFLLIWMYTTSFLVTLMTLIAVVFSLGIAYFVYVTIFKISFFPFMNLLTVVIAIGIGADDAFIYCKIWVCAKAEKNNGTLVKLVKDTLTHACLSMLVTSFTTAAAFFGSYISSITAVRCFSIFSGTAVLANLLFTVTCLPASIIMAEKWCSWSCCLCIPPFGVYLPPFQRFKCCALICNQLWKMHYAFVDSARIFFEKILPCLVIKPRYFWLMFYTVIALAASITVFYYPRLRLPDSKDFQIFGASHPFERYDLVLKHRFWFEKAKEKDAYHKMPIRIVWGVQPLDNGDHLNPFDRGTLSLEPSFSVTSQASQMWLLSFCKQLRNQSFYQSTQGPLLPNCFIETFKSWMERRCVDGISKTNRTPCCESSRFPFVPDVFDLCIREAISTLHRTPGYYFIPGVAGPRFSAETGQIRAVVVEYDSVYSYSNSYTEMNRFANEVESWVEKMLESAPPGMKKGWFSSDLEFYDLQASLAEGTLVAMGVAIGVSFVALLMTTLNLLISLYAILTIACIMVVTVGSLVLLGWKLNILESITVSVAIGLAVDFTLHYGVAYRLSSQEDRESSVIYSLSRIGSPVAMGAFTTLVAGALMFPSAVLAYLQIATFLVLVTAVSWLYATFFFQSLLSLAGPQNGHLQLQYPTLGRCCICCACWPTTASVPADKPAYALSESTLSTSSASYHAGATTQIPLNETHELEPLTTNITVLKTETLKFKKKSRTLTGQRSGSFSAALLGTHDPAALLMLSGQPGLDIIRSRKVSLPTVTFHESPSEMQLPTSNSCSTILVTEGSHDDPAQSDSAHGRI